MSRLIPTGVTRYPKPSTLPLQITQARTFCYHKRGKKGPKSESQQRQRHIFAKHHKKRLRHHPHILDDKHPWWKLGWGRFESNFADEHHREWDKWEKKFWDEEARFNERMEALKKEIEKDPYTAVFGRRLEPFLWHGEQCGGLSGFMRSLWGVGSDLDWKVKDTASGGSNESTTAKNSDVKKGVQTDIPEKDDSEFDPITGRMVPKKSKVVDVDGIDVSAKDSAASAGSYASEDGRQGDIYTGESLSYSSDINSQLGKQAQTVQEKEPVDVKSSDSSHESPPSDALQNDNEVPRVIMAEPPQPESDISLKQDVSPFVVHCTGTRDGSVGRSSPLSDEDTWVKTEPKPSEPSERLPKQEAEDLEFLSASDIRASYNSRKTESPTDAEKQDIRRALEDELDCYVDPASGIDAHEIRSRHQHDMLDSTTDEVLPVPETCESTDSALESDQSSQSDSPALYRILAYDSSTLQMTRADTSSSKQASDETRHPTEVLSRLNNVAKFLPYFAEMHSDGYEVVSGGGDILVFKKVREAIQRPDEAPPTVGTDPKTPDAVRDIAYAADVNFIENSAKEQTHEPTRTAQWQQTVYSGSYPEWPQYPSPMHYEPEPVRSVPPQERSGFRQTARRMLLAGVITAASCYAIGVVGEYFRTGGQDRRGIDGFTEFESERRRRDQ